ncbi:MFS transporter [bacterium]|nr:MFS transporter [bacterium]
MEATQYRIYPYRWIVLLVYMFAVSINQLLWITFAPITSSAAAHFGVSDLSIGLLSMSFMIVYLFVSFPASWVIDTYGIRVAVGIGAVLTGIFGLMRGLAAPDYTLVLISQIGIAVGQPFVLNAITKVAASWFPLQERATASGLGTLAIYLGIFGGLALTPLLTLKAGLDGMLVIYGVVALVIAVIFLIAAKEHPPTPPCPPDQEERTLVLEGYKQMMRKKDFILLMVIFFIGLGLFNGVTTWIENIVGPRGFSITQAGMIGSLMILGGIIGAVVIPLLSDRYRKRTPFIVLALAGTIAGLAGITWAGTYGLLLASAFIMGLFLLSSGPIGFQYGAEITYPAPEAASNGILLLMGQISGIIFIFGMDLFKSKETGSMTLSLVVLIILTAVSLVLAARLRESALMTENRDT